MPLLFSYGTLQRELEQADLYETDPAYRRFATRLLPGIEAWVYADARFEPAVPS